MRGLFVATVLIANFISVACGAEMIYAHVFPDHSEPRVGATVAAPPSVRIWFSGALEPTLSTLRVQNATGKRVDKGDARVNPSNHTLLEVSVPSLPPGTYRVIWSVVAKDGHKAEGDFTFTVKER
jgi:methionine-rich copper-binding protein CopC